MKLRVAQCWDDSVSTDIRVAEICRRYNAKATFNLNPGLAEKSTRAFGWERNGFRIQRLSQSEMPSVYEGLQVANHTLRHPHPTQVSKEELQREIFDGKHWIEDAFQREIPGFAWPFGEYNDVALEILRESGAAYGRTTKNVERVLPCEDPMALHANCHFLNPDFDRLLEKSREHGVFYFWGHSFEMTDDAKMWAAYERRIAALSNDPEIEWVDVIDLVR